MKRLFASRLFSRYFLLFAANLVFFIIVLSVVVYFVFVQRFIQGQYAQASINGLSKVSASVEYFIKKADDIAKYYSLFDNEAISYSYRPLVQGSQLYQFLSRVRGQGYVDGNIHSIYLYYRTADRLVDISRSEAYTLFPEDTSLVRTERRGDFYDTGWLAAALEGRFNPQGYILLDTRPLYVIRDISNMDVNEMNLVNAHPNANVISLIRAFENNVASPRGYIIANVSEDAVSRYLLNAHAGSPETTFVVNARGTVISAEDKTSLGKNISAEGYVKTILGSRSADGFLTARAGGRRYAVVYVRSVLTDWTYISMVPWSWLTRDLGALTRVIIAVILLIAAGAVLSVYLLSRRAYAPIEKIFGKITRTVSEPPRGMASGELQLVESVLDEMRRNYDHLGKLVFDNLYLLKYNFLNRLIAGECDAQEMQEGCREFNVCLDRPGFVMVAVVIDDFAHAMESLGLSELYVAKQTIINIFEKTLGERWIATGTSSDQRHMAVIVNGIGEREIGDLAGALAEAVRRVFELLPLQVSAGVGGHAADTVDLGHSHREAMLALQNRMRKGRGAVIRFEEVRSSLAESPHNLAPNIEAVVAALRQGREERCLGALDDLVAEIKARGLPRGQVEALFLDLLVTVHRALVIADLDFDAISGTSIGDALGSVTTFETLDDLHDSVGTLLARIAGHYGGSKRGHNAEVITRVMAHLRGHYGEMLSLDVVADALKITPQHLSRLVKQETGINFLEYLTGVRMAKAEELLVSTTLPVQEVASRVGYQTYRTFLLNFRAHTAMIPTQYRKMKNRIVSP